MLILLTVIVIIEFVCVVYYTPHAFLYWPAPVLVIYGVLGYYFDESESTGARSWERMRNWWKWSEVSYAYGYEEEEIRNGKGSRLFIVIGNTTNMGLISGFGLHGGELSKLDICYVLPSLYFVVPIAREILLWTGALSENDLTNTILSAMKRGKSLAISVDKGLDKSLFGFVKTEKIQIVPVLIGCENERYTVYESCMPRCPWFVHWTLNKDPPPRLTIDFLAVLSPAKYENLEEFNIEFNKFVTYPEVV